MEKKADVKSVNGREAFLEVSRTVLGGQTSKIEKIKIRPFATATASVSIKYGLTIPTVQYGSARVDVMMSCPCYKEEMLEVYEQLRAMVEKLVVDEQEKFERPKEE